MRDGQHRGGCRLAGGAGDRDARAGRPSPRPARRRAAARGRPSRCASTSSALSGRIALDIDDGVGVGDVRPVVADVDRRAQRPQRGKRARVLRVACRDDMPRASMIRAMPLMPAPPMPMKCTRPSSAATGTSTCCESVSQVSIGQIW